MTLNEAISRQAAIDALSHMCSEDENGITVSRANVNSMLRVLPPVQPMPKMGHWVEYTRVLIPEPINRWEQAWYCSECGYGNQECEDGSAWLEWKYCPNCGAKMQEVEDGNK